MPRIPSLARHPLALACLLLACPAWAEDEPVLPSIPPEGTAEAVVAMPADALPPAAVRASPCRGHEVSDPRWFDRAQEYFSERACTPATWFDRFFGGERTDDQVASALLKVIPSVQFSERDFTDSGVRVRGRVNLPNVRERFNLVINDDAEEEEGLLRGETQRPQQANAPTRESSAALRYLVRMAGRSGADIDIGLRGEAKFFSRARYYYTWEHSPVLESRITQSLFFRDGEGFGETSRYEVERMLAEDMLLRWSTQATVSELANGLEMREGIQLLRQIDRRRAISWGIAMTVNSDPAWKANAYATSVRYRQNAFRPWFYFEIEPFVDAVRADRFSPNPGIAFRVEFWLGDAPGNDEPRPPRVAPAATAAPATTPVPLPEFVPGSAPESVPAVEPPAVLTNPGDGNPTGVP